MEAIDRKNGYVFDNDGTLVNTHEFIFQAFENSGRILGKQIDRENIHRLLGLSLKVCYHNLLPEADITLCCKMHDEFQKDNPQLIRAFHGVLDTLEELRRRGVPLAIVTNWSGGLPASLRVTGIDQIVKTVITCDDVTHPKPHPEMIWKALAALRLDPQQAEMVGDSSADIQAGNAAHVRWITGVDYDLTRKALLLSQGADRVISNFPDLLNF